MASSSLEDWRGRPVEYGRPSGGKPESRPVWSLWNSGTIAHAEVHAHPLGHQLCVYMDGSLLFTSVHLTREAAEQQARELRQQALAGAWTDPWNAPTNG
jgi:hypothetical protein